MYIHFFFFFEFREDNLNSVLYTAPASDLTTLIGQYESIMCDLLDKHTPEVTCKITARPHAPWYNDSMREAKQHLRRFERLWNSTMLEVYRQVFNDQRARYKKMLENAKTEHFRCSFENCNVQKLFQKVHKLATPAKFSSEDIGPSTDNVRDITIAGQFSNFFGNKVKVIKQDLEWNKHPSSSSTSSGRKVNTQVHSDHPNC